MFCAASSEQGVIPQGAQSVDGMQVAHHKNSGSVAQQNAHE
jgi:hypothetical protein